MSFLRRRLTCFYCNRPSQTAWSAGLKSFHCQLCDATNHLDEKGEITDPPTPKASRIQDNRRFAQEIGTGRGIFQKDTSSSPFCHTCTNNQQVIRQSLAEYLPPPSDPRYREYERNYDNYRRDLEARYPSVCANCEPRVREQLEKAGYKARADYMRNMLTKTKTRLPIRTGWSRKHVLGYLGFPLWGMALFFQLAWHFFGVLAVPDDGLRNPEADNSLAGCIHYALSERHVEQSCVHDAYDRLKLALVLNVLTIWWNPIMLRATNRAQGLGEYYKLQFLLLTSRYAAWFSLGRNATLDENSAKGTHAVLLVLDLVITAVCLRLARPKMSKPIDFSQKIPRLVDTKPVQTAPVAPLPVTKPASALPSVSGSRNSAFPIARLGMQHKPEVNNDLPPMPDFPMDDPDAMDIDQVPSQATMLYREGYTNGNILRPRHTETALNGGPAQNTRSGGRRQSATQRNGRAFPGLMSVTTAADDDEEDNSSPLGFDQSFIPANLRDRKNYKFAEPKLNVPANDTGLEGMFKDFFGLQDEPAAGGQIEGEPEEQLLVAKPKKAKQDVPKSIPGFGKIVKTTRKQKPAAWEQIPVPVLTMPVFFLSLALATGVGIGSNLTANTEIAMLGWVAAIGVTRLSDEVSPRRLYWELSNVLIYIGESAVAAYLVIGRLKQSSLFSGPNLNEHATLTKPFDPAVGPEMDLLDSEQLPLNGAQAAAEGSGDVFDLGHAFYLLVIWIVLQEAIIAYRSRRPGVRIS